MNDQERTMAKYIRELEIYALKNCSNVCEKDRIVESISALSEQLTLAVGRRIIKETYKNGQASVS